MQDSKRAHESATRQKVNILLVDDQPANLVALEALLADPGVNLVKARSGEEALRSLLETDFAVILLDVQMQGLDGFETAKLIRGREKSRSTPIIFLTAYESNRLPVNEAYGLGAVDYLVKPLVPVILRAKVKGFVELFEKTEQIKRQAEQLRQMERREFEQKLAEENARLQAIIDNWPALIFVKDLQGRFVLANRAYERITGDAPKSMTGKTNYDFFPPEVADAMRSFDQKALQGGEAVRYEESFPVHGETRYYLTVKFPLLDAAGKANGVCGIAMDVTERRRAEESSRFLAEASAVLAGLVDYESTLQRVARLAVPFFADWCAVDLAENDGRLHRLALVHRDADKMRLGEELSRRYPPDAEGKTGTGFIFRSGDARLVREITDDVLVQSARDEEHLQQLRLLGLKSYIGVPLHRAGRPIGVLTFAMGESGRLYSEADLDLAKDLAHRAGVAIENARLYAELREADRLKDEFLAMLAHELRNPLTPIRNSLHIMKQPAADVAMIGRVREMAERQVQHMARLLDDLLDVSRISRGRIELRLQTVDLNALVQRTVEAIGAFMAERNHQLTVSVPPQAVRVQGDPARLEQILTNLLNNAAKYTDPGGRIWLTVQHDEGDVLLRVRDTGIGITPEMLPRIFDLFVQAERRIDRAQGGVGIGLTLVRKLVELHGGRIQATSAGLGRGSEFVVHLPARVEHPYPGEDSKGQDGPTPGKGRRYRVLVVDDNVDAADSLAVLLRLHGQEVQVAYDGPSALEVAHNCLPQIVLLDLGMPEMDGNEVARRLRQQPGLKDALLVAMTGWGQEDDRRRSREAGFNLHLVKPVEPEVLQKLLTDPARLES